jgi:hypothetical protein
MTLSTTLRFVMLGLSVAIKPIMMRVVMLNVVAPFLPLNHIYREPIQLLTVIAVYGL